MNPEIRKHFSDMESIIREWGKEKGFDEKKIDDDTKELEESCKAHEESVNKDYKKIINESQEKVKEHEGDIPYLAPYREIVSKSDIDVFGNPYGVVWNRWCSKHKEYFD